MMSSDPGFDNAYDDVDISAPAGDSFGEGLTPFEDPSAGPERDTGRTLGFLAQKLQTQSCRYLLQLRCELPRDQRQRDDQQCALNLLARSITTLGGQVEQQWTTPYEYDLVLVMGLRSHQISTAAIAMAIEALPLTKSLRITPLLPLDEPQCDVEDASDRPIIADRARQSVEGETGAE
jgi:hypothetical protein